MLMEQLNQLSSVFCFGGLLNTYSHQSKVNNCTMRFAVYLPPQAQQNQHLPVLYWLSGLTCTEENFIAKAGAQRYAAEHGIILVAPDTSPRGEDVPDDPEASWDFGLGAGFYLNATEAPWSKHYNMYDYVVEELPELINNHFNTLPERQSISGHSMGGHGALSIALKNPGKYCSVSAFSPIVAPSQVPWGNKAFSNYLGENQQDWLAYDSCHLIENPVDPQAAKIPMLVSQGEADNFLVEQLKPQLLAQAAKRAEHPVTIESHPGYDHSYYFISSFIGQHLAFHAQHLK
jgi:S-formylglutathione hydrolase